MVLKFMMRNRGRRGTGPFWMESWKPPVNVASSVISNFLKRSIARKRAARTRPAGIPAPRRSRIRWNQIPRSTRSGMVSATRRRLKRFSRKVVTLPPHLKRW